MNECFVRSTLAQMEKSVLATTAAARSFGAIWLIVGSRLCVPRWTILPVCVDLVRSAPIRAWSVGGISAARSNTSGAPDHQAVNDAEGSASLLLANSVRCCETRLISRQPGGGAIEETGARIELHEDRRPEEQTTERIVLQRPSPG